MASMYGPSLPEGWHERQRGRGGDGGEEEGEEETDEASSESDTR